MNYKYVLLSSDKSQETFHLNPNNPIILGNDPMVGVKLLVLYYTYPNISEKYKNNKISLFYDNAWNEVEIPKGLYEIKTLNKFIHKQIGNNTGIVLEINEATFHCDVILQSNYKIDFTKSKLNELLGLESKIYDKPEESGKDIININRGVDDVLIRCNLVGRTEQLEFTDCLYDTLPNAKPGEAIVHEIQNIEYYPCKDQEIRSIQIRITDIKGKLLEMREKYIIKLVFKSRIE